MGQIKIGDKIEFSKSPYLQEKLIVDVIDLYREDTFENLFRKLYSDEEEIIQKTRTMHTIYSPEKEQQYGILGIKIKINGKIWITLKKECELKWIKKK